METLLTAYETEAVDAHEVRKRHPIRILNGWELKAFAILHCPFEEVLFLDADNTCTKNPEYLFETPEFRKTGAVFWPDFGRLAPDRDIWNICEVEYRDEPEFESGQILVNKSKCWNALSLSMHLNEYSDFYYRHIHGDKETFHLAFRRLNQPYSMPAFPLTPLKYTMCQHDFEGTRIFQHRNFAKWRLGESNKRIPDFFHEDKCLIYLRDLRKKWSMRVGPIRTFNSKYASTQELELGHRLTSVPWIYSRVGFDARKMTFDTDGLIGHGASSCEQLWSVSVVDDSPKLTIYSLTDPTCRLSMRPEGLWIGRWLTHERMPVLLIPPNASDAVVSLVTMESLRE